MFDKEDWKERFKNGTCTIEQLYRLRNIEKITDKDIADFIKHKEEGEHNVITRA